MNLQMHEYDAVVECQEQGSCIGIAVFAGNNDFLKVEAASDVTGYQWGDDKSAMVAAKGICL